MNCDKHDPSRDLRKCTCHPADNRPVPCARKFAYTFATGKRDQYGLPIHRHEPLTAGEADALMQHAEQRQRERVERMPDEKAAINALFDAWLRLKDFGWKEPMYCPKDGTPFKIIELGSTGIFDGAYRGTWPDGSWDSWDEHDSYCSSIAPAMFKLLPEDQAKEDARRAALREQFSQKTAEEK